jgi:hypothetical protein
MTETVAVEIRVSKPYVVIAGGWTGMRPVGRRRDYSAMVNGRQFTNTSKAEIQRVIRQKLRPARPIFTFVED